MTSPGTCSCRHGTPLAIGRYVFVAGAWSLTTNGVDMVVAGYPLVDVVIGNEVELGRAARQHHELRGRNAWPTPTRSTSCACASRCPA